MSELPWNEKVPMLSINPDAATNVDIARLAAELMEANHKLNLGVSQTFEKLHENKAFAHWLWVAIERVVAGEPVEEVMADYGYKKHTGKLLHVIESSMTIAKDSNKSPYFNCALINHVIQFAGEDSECPFMETETMEYRIIIEAKNE